MNACCVKLHGLTAVIEAPPFNNAPHSRLPWISNLIGEIGSLPCDRSVSHRLQGSICSCFSSPACPSALHALQHEWLRRSMGTSPQQVQTHFSITLQGLAMSVAPAARLPLSPRIPQSFFTTVLQHGVRADAWSSRGAGREAAAPLLTAHASPSHCAVRRCRCAVRRVVWEPGASSGTCAVRSAGPTRTITRATWAGAHVGMPSCCMHAHCSRRRCLCLLRLTDHRSMSMRLSQRVQEALRRRLALQGHRAGEDVRAGAAAE